MTRYAGYLAIFMIVLCFGSVGELGAAVPPPPPGSNTGGLFAEYFKNAVNNNGTDCLTSYGEIFAGFRSHPYFEKNCVEGLFLSDAAGSVWLKGEDTKLGLGTGSADYTLDLSGSVRFNIGGNPNGQVLMGDANGVLKWADIPETCVPGGSGVGNVCQGYLAMTGNTSGSYNIGFGTESLKNIGAGSYNIGIGYRSLMRATNTGNTSVGVMSLNAVIDGNYNTAFGYYALRNATGSYNVALGVNAGKDLVSGTGNIAIGQNAAVPSNNGSYQLSIGNIIYGTGVDGLGNGFIGIGASVPTVKLDIKAGNSASLIYGTSIRNTSNTAGAAIAYAFGLESTTKKGAIIFSRNGGWGRGDMHFALNNSGSAQDVSIADVKMSILSTGLVGIGNISPSYPLDLSGSTLRVRNPSGVTASLRLANSIDNNGLLTYSGGDMNFLVKNTQRMQIGSGGNIGIGYSNPQYKLDVNGTIRSTANTAFIWSDNFAKLTNAEGGSIELGGNNTYTGAGTPYIDFHYNGLLQDYNTRIINSGDGRMDYLAATAYFNGNVGIGDTTPSYKLDVAGTGAFVGVRITGGASAGKILTSDASGNASWQTLVITDTKWDGGNTGLNAASGRTSLNLGTLATLNAIASSNITDGTIVAADIANYTIGTTKINTGAITSASIANGVIIAEDIATDAVTAPKIAQDAVGLSEIANNAVGSGELLNDAVITAKIKDGSVTSAKITDGTITLTDMISTSYSTSADANKLVQRDGSKFIYAAGFLYSSDKKLKKEIAPLTGALKKILSLNGYSFVWKESGKRDLGVIAQEVEKVFPDLVHTDAETGMKSVEYANLIAPVIEAIKSQQQIIEEQNIRIQSLERRLEALEAKMK